LINAASNTPEYYVWYNVGGGGTDPNLAGKTGIAVNIPTGASYNTVLQNTRVAIETASEFITNIIDEGLEVRNVIIGACSPSEDVNTGFSISTKAIGSFRKLLVTLILTYDSSNELLSVERL
jgi:hypothetical protein